MGTDQTVVAARAWHASVFRLQRIASGAVAEVSWAEAVEATSRARRGFYEVAKRDIGISVGDAPGDPQFRFGLGHDEGFVVDAGADLRAFERDDLALIEVDFLGS